MAPPKVQGTKKYNPALCPKGERWEQPSWPRWPSLEPSQRVRPECCGAICAKIRTSLLGDGKALRRKQVWHIRGTGSRPVAGDSDRRGGRRGLKSTITSKSIFLPSSTLVTLYFILFQEARLLSLRSKLVYVTPFSYLLFLLLTLASGSTGTAPWISGCAS